MNVKPTPLGTSRLLEFGHRLSRAGQFTDAEQCFSQAITLDPECAMAYNNLGWTRQRLGDLTSAESLYRQALSRDKELRLARRNLAKLLLRLGRDEEALPLFRAELNQGDDGLAWIQGLVNNALKARDLTLAGQYAAMTARLRWGEGLNPPGHVDPSPSYPPSIPKLRHDADQFRYLRRQGVLGTEIEPVIDAYEDLIDRLMPRGPEARQELDSNESRAIGHAYNRLLHTRETPRVTRALSDKWDRDAVERMYLDTPPGVVYVDNFLSPAALDGLRKFCLESTIWSGSRYAHGRLGAFFQDGFNCPLLLQIGEELREALPRMIGYRYPLRQLWGFKCGPELPADATTHADFAAVNVNFWITPDEANLDPESGGLVVYDVDAPLSWDFDTYNGRTDVIKPFLQRQHSRAMNIPYRANRAVIFNSDLFHASAGVSFRPGYENLRVNITMLYGEREDEVHHREMHHPDPMSESHELIPAWRSAAFRHTRTSRPGP
ncbi:tetratricopeptide repeat protein [Streptomyces paludis]|uniref:tetratricopeptide repeat protein n=1 Tax=Streptomyces paludis TaxID=2282738 RepID=UPI0013B385F4|nr:tetratricopeptide repeat protein [Streptomyces paludis]